MSATPTILGGCAEDTVWLRVIGKGTFQTSGCLKKYSKRMMGRGYRKFLIDLSECEVMDSTFMGTLAGLALHLKEEGGGVFQVVQANVRNAALLANLGLDQLFPVCAQGDPTAPQPPQAAELAPAAEAGPAGAQEILEAHQALVEADEANMVRFHDVIELLEKDCRGGGE